MNTPPPPGPLPANRFRHVRQSGTAFACLLAVGCAQIEERVTLRAQPLEQERTQRVETGKRLGIAGERQGPAVQAQIFAVTWCAIERRQRARGIKRVERSAVGHSLTLEWVFGAMFLASGGTMFAVNKLNPPDPKVSLRTEDAGYLFAGSLGAVGLALLTGALVQTVSLGHSDVDLGEREMIKHGTEFQCKREPAPGGRVRLTLADGLQIEADAGPTGAATLLLPLNVEEHLGEGRKATLEAIGDVKAQVRIAL